jgi:hypothetical protein
MEKKRVKGTLLLDYVRMIRANKDKDWRKYLTPEDWEIINGRILPSLWYPYETFKRGGMAAFYLLGGGNLDAVRAWGKISMEYLTKGVYKSIVADPDPVMALERFVIMRRQFFNFVAMEFEKIGEKHVKIILAGAPDDSSIDAYGAQLAGGLERLVELTGGKNPHIKYINRPSAGESNTEFDISWD